MDNFFHFHPPPAYLLCTQNANFPFKSSSAEVSTDLNKWNSFKQCVPHGIKRDFPEMSRQLISLAMYFLMHVQSKTSASIYWQYAKVIASHKQKKLFICNYWHMFSLLDFQSCSRESKLVWFFSIWISFLCKKLANVTLLSTKWKVIIQTHSAMKRGNAPACMHFLLI